MITKDAATKLINAADVRERVRRAALSALPSTGARCAATLSLWLQEFDIFPPARIYTWTSDLLNHLPQWERIISPSLVQPLDIMVSQDNNRNGAPDHVGIIIGSLGTPPRYNVTFIDNQQNFQPYTRNLGPGPKTPMAYALRIPWASDSLLDDLAALHEAAKLFDATQPGPPIATAAFNRVRRAPGMPPIN